MKHKTSAYHIPVFLYRRGFLIPTLLLQVFLLNGTNLSPYIYARVAVAFSVSLFVFSYIYYKNIRVYSHPKTLNLKEGIFLCQHTLFPLKDIRCITFSQGPLQKILKVCSITIHSSLCSSSVYLKTEPYLFIRHISDCSKSKPSLQIKSNLFAVLLLSLGFYNAFTGALTLVPFFRKLSVLSSGSDNYNIHFLTVDFHSALPVLLFSLWVSIILLWLVGILLNIFRFYGLSLTISKNNITTSRGLIIRHTTQIPKKHICAVTFRQNLLMILMNRYTGEFISSCKRKEKRTAFLCGAKKETCLNTLKHLKKTSERSKKTLRLKPLSLWGYTYLPITLLFVFSALSVIADKYSPYIARTRIGLFIILWLVGWFFFRLCIFTRCFANLNSDMLTIGYYRGLTYCLAYIPKNKIRKLKITQTVFQKEKGTCSLRIYIRGQQRAVGFIKHTDKEKAAELEFKLCGHI